MAYSSNAYDIEYFESRSAAQPLRKEEQVQRKNNLKKIDSKTSEQLRAEEFRSLKKSVAVLSFVLVLFAMVSLQISAGAKNYELMREIQKAEAALEIQQSENIRLNSALNGITGITVIDTYATDVLGMTKVENYQIECIDLSEGDAVLYTSGLFSK